MKYRISKNISFGAYRNGSKIPADNLLLKDKGSNREFIINNTTRLFIEKFRNPKDLNEITNEIAGEVNAPIAEVKKLIEPFFRYVKYRGFIVPEHSSEVTMRRKPLLYKHKIIDQYKVLNSIDINEDVEIYHAIDLKSENDVVIKLLPQPKKKAVDELWREYNFLYRLNKTAIAPKAYDFIQQKEHAYFSQEYIEGAGLPEYISLKKNYTRNNIYGIIMQIISGFKKIHVKGIVHGDIHPSNIIITKSNTIKIIDFGLAINYELEKNELVNFGGAYFYMPPERINTTTCKKFSRKPDFYSDVYQIGIVMYDLLYHKYPFNGFTWEELAKEIKEKETVYPPKSHYKFTMPQWLIDIMQKCTEKDPSKRFKNASQLYSCFLKHTRNESAVRPTVKI